MNNVFLAKSIDNKLNLGSETNRARLNEDLKSHPNAVYRIERVVPKRTLAQNNYLWLYLEVIERETGNDTASMHEYVKKYLTPKVERKVKILENEKWVTHKGMVGKGTSELSKIEMGDVLDKLCSLTEVPLPDPIEAGYLPR